LAGNTSLRCSYSSLPNTRDKLRGVRTSTLVLQNSDPVPTRGYPAALRLQPPLVSFIALFDRRAFEESLASDAGQRPRQREAAD